MIGATGHPGTPGAVGKDSSPQSGRYVQGARAWLVYIQAGIYQAGISGWYISRWWARLPQGPERKEADNGTSVLLFFIITFDGQLIR